MIPLWLVVFVLVLLALASAHAACPSTPSAVEAQLDSAQVAFKLMDRTAFTAATDEARANLECLSEPVSPALAARVHRVAGLREFFAGNDAAALLAFGAARAIDGAYEFPESIVPAAHPVRALYAAATSVSTATVGTALPADGALQFDGTPSAFRPSERPTLALHVRADHSVAASAYLWPGDPLFPYAVATTSMNSVATKTVKPGRGPNLPMAIAAGVSGLAAGGAFLLARQSHEAFWDEATPESELEGLMIQTDTFQTTAVVLGVAGLGLGVGAVVTGDW